MKKYQLKYNTGTELVIVEQSDILYDILVFINGYLDDIAPFSVWMDGKVLD